LQRIDGGIKLGFQAKNGAACIREVCMIAILLIALMFVAGPAYGNDLAGNWKLVSFQTIYDNDPTPKDMYGASPKGYLSMSKDGRMIALITGEGRKPGNSDAERAALHKSMISYTGIYRTNGDEFITSVDASWNEAWNGSEQKRKYRIEGDRLIIDSAPGPSVLFPDRTAFARLVWQRDK
jgi:hypothetical protein